MTDLYLGRPQGPHAGAELLCPACGGLLALGWLPGVESANALGPTVSCRLCRLHVPVGACVGGAPAERRRPSWGHVTV